MPTDKKTTVPNPSVGADGEQPLLKETTCSISNKSKERNPVNHDLEAQHRKMQHMADPSSLSTITMRELYDTVYESRPSIVDGLLYPGTYLFAGAPKLGKSFLMLQFAYHVSMGVPLWGYPVQQSTVLYLSLEDDHRRLQGRLFRMFGVDCADSLHLATIAKQVGCGLDAQLCGFMREHPDTKLVMIDTLQKVREVGSEKYSYAGDYEVVRQLKQFSDTFGVCLLLVHHTRKQQADDKFDMISGTNGLMGAADGAFLLQKEQRTGNAALLEVSGRDQQDQRFRLVRDTQTLAWILEKAEMELWRMPADPLLEELASRIDAANPVWCGAPSDLVSFLGTGMKANALTMKLNVSAGRLLEEHHIHYENSRSHDGRRVTLSYVPPPQRDDV